MTWIKGDMRGSCIGMHRLLDLCKSKLDGLLLVGKVGSPCPKQPFIVVYDRAAVTDALPTDTDLQLKVRNGRQPATHKQISALAARRHSARRLAAFPAKNAQYAPPMAAASGSSNRKG